MKLLKLCLFFLLFSFTSQVYAQVFEGGLTVGFNGTQIDGDKVSGYHKLGAAFGGWVQTDLPKNLFFAMELKVNQKGSRMTPTQQNDYNKFVLRLDYIDLPVIIGYKFNDLLSVYIGGSYGYLFHKSYKSNYNGDDVDDYNIKDWDLNSIAGFKVNFESMINREWSKNIELDIRFQNSFISINENNTFIVGNWNNGEYNRLLSTSLFIPIKRNKN